MIRFCENCHSPLPLDPGEECRLCGHVAADKVTAILDSRRRLHGTRYYFQSQVDFKPGTKTGIWKKCGTEGGDEAYCMQMAHLNFNVRKVVYD